MNWSPLSDTTLSGNPCNFYILSLNSLAKPFTNVPSVAATKCVIFDSLLQTTRIASFLATTGNFVIKSTIRYVYGFSGISLSFNFLSPYISCYSWLPIIPCNQFYCLPPFSMSYCWHIVVLLDYLCSQLFILWYIYLSFLQH